jgi:hypothetical protein
MAVPTITQISPATGHAGGRTVVKITGTNFAVPPDPETLGTWAQTVQVLFGDEAAEQVLPYGDDLVACVSPPFTGSPASSASVDVTIKNLDPDTGEPVLGESVTEVDGFTYTRDAVTEQEAVAWIGDYLVMMMKRQICDNVLIAKAHPDYDPDQGTGGVEISNVPAVVLTLREELFGKLGTGYSAAGVGTAASVTDTTSYPVVAGSGSMYLKVDREDESQKVTFAGTETTAAQVAAALDAQLDGASAEEDGGQVTITSDTTGALSFVQVTKNPTAAPLLTFPTSEQQGTPDEFTREMGGRQVDLVYDVRGIEEYSSRSENLSARLQEFVDRSGYVDVPETVGDVDSERVRIWLTMVSEPVFPELTESNEPVKEFVATIALKNVVLVKSGIAPLSEDFHGYVGAADVDLDLVRNSDT